MKFGIGAYSKSKKVKLSTVLNDFAMKAYGGVDV
jgi:hypothetical protein